MRLQAPRGTVDVLPAAAASWRRIETVFWEVARSFGYGEIRTPVFEDTALFARTSGETSDVVSKEMYTFLDRSDRSLTLKPELTAPVMRALIEHSALPPSGVGRLAYVGPIFRYGRPQAGRLREAHQFGIELVGAKSVEGEVEVIELLVAVLRGLGLRRFSVPVNSIGRAEARDAFRAALLAHMEGWMAEQDDETRAKTLKNPLRLLDTKDPAVRERLQGLASILDFLEPESRARYDRLLARCAALSLPVRPDPGIVRGLDYYTETVFEVIAEGFEPSLAGGGRYDGLIAQLGGADLPAVGFGAGIERVLMALAKEEIASPTAAPDIYALHLDEPSAEVVDAAVRDLRAAGAAVARHLDGAGIKSGLKQADRSGARYALLVGEGERGMGAAQLKDLRGGVAENVPFDGLGAWWSGRA